MDMESQTLSLQSLQSKIGELTEFITTSGDKSVLSSSDADGILRDFVLDFDRKANQIVAEHSDVAHFSDEDFDAYLDRLRAELTATEAESASICEEIDNLAKSYVEGTCQLESNLASLSHVVGGIQTEELEPANTAEQYQNLAKAHLDDSFEILKLKHQVEVKKATLKSLQDLDLDLKRIEAIEKIQEALTGLKIIDVEGNIIRVSLRTYIPDVEGLMCQLNAEDSTKPSEVNHELLIEVLDGSTELKNVEIFPNDLYLGDIVEAANTFSKSISGLPVLETRNSLGWFLQKVQDKVVLCSLRRLMVNTANTSRHSFEYLDKDELIIAHMAGGIDAFLKPSQGWPLSRSALKLVSLRSSDQNSTEISLTLLSRVEEKANSLELDIRKSMTTFVDCIQEVLLEKMHPELH